MAKKNNRYNFLNIPRNIYFMGLVSLFNDIASEIIYPLLPIFLTTTLKAPVSLVGFIEGFAEGISGILKVFSGWISDLTGRRKPFVVLGYSLSTVAKFLFVLATRWPLFFIARTFDRFGKGVRTSARDALISQSTLNNSHGAAFGLHRAFDATGAVLGPLIALGLWYLTAPNMRPIFLIAAIPSILGVIILIAAVREIRTQPKPTTLTKTSFSPNFIKFLVITAIFSLGNSSEAFILLRAQYLGLSIAMIIGIHIITNLTRALISLPAGILSDRFGARKIMSLGFLVFAFVYGSFGYFQSTLALVFLCSGYGFYLALTDGVGRAYVAQIVPETARATAYGIYQITVGLCVFTASFAAGLLWQLHPNLPFFLSGLLALLATVLLLITSDKKTSE